MYVYVLYKLKKNEFEFESDFLSAHNLFVLCQSRLSFLGYVFFKIWPWKSKVSIKAQGHTVGLAILLTYTILFHVNRPSCSWNTAFFSKSNHENSRLRSRERSKFKATQCVPLPIDSQPFLSMLIDTDTAFFKIWPWQFKVNVMGEVNVQSHKVCSTCYRFTSLSFCVNMPSCSRDTVFTTFDLENPRSMS